MNVLRRGVRKHLDETRPVVGAYIAQLKHFAGEELDGVLPVGLAERFVHEVGPRLVVMFADRAIVAVARIARIKLRLLRFGLMIERITREDASNMTLPADRINLAAPIECVTARFELRRIGLNRPSLACYICLRLSYFASAAFLRNPWRRDVRDHTRKWVFYRGGCCFLVR
jgi:hypothetical protein